MKVFKLITYDPRPSVIGVSNGIYQLEFKEKELKKNKNYEEIEQVLMTFDLQFEKNVLGLSIKYLKGSLLKKAKITDLMVFAPHFLGCKYLISKKVANCLAETVSSEQYDLREVEIEGSDKVFYLLFVPTIKMESIDFSETRIFLEKEYLSNTKNYFKIDSFSKFSDLLDENPLISFDRIGLPIAYVERDILAIQGVADLFFSDRLIKKLQAIDITNFRISNRQIELVFTKSRPD